MADQLIAEAAQAVAEEGGTVALTPDPAVEATENGGATGESSGEPRPKVAPEPEPAPAPVVVMLAPEDRGMLDAHENRLGALEQRMAEIEMVRLPMYESELIQANTLISGKADAGHDHAPDEDLRIIAEELRALREEEVAPDRARFGMRRGWLGRRLRGKG